jgi:hypothetical protein
MGSSIQRFLDQSKDGPQKREDSQVGRWLTGEDEDAKLKLSVHVADPSQADKSARILRLQTKTGLPQDLIERNLDSIETQARKSDFNADAFRRASPIVAKWLAENPHNVAVATPDLKKLSWMEQEFGYVADQWKQGVALTELTQIGLAAMDGTITSAQRKRQVELDEQSTHFRSHDDYGWLGNVFADLPGAVANQIPIFGMTLGGQVEGAAKGAAAGTAVGLAGALPGAAVGATAGALLGWRLGAGLQAARMEGALAYLEYEKLKDENNKPLSRETALGAAVITGVVNGALEMVGFESISRNIPGLRGLQRGAIKKALMSETSRKAFSRYARGVGESTILNGGQEYLQDVMKNGAEEIALMINDGSIKTASPGQIIDRIFSPAHVAEGLSDAYQGALGGGGMSAAGGSISLGIDVQRARNARKISNFFQALGETTSNSELVKKLPDKMQEVVARITKDGPAETAHTPVDAWNTYWQGHNLAPEDVADELGIRSQYDEAVSTGGDIAIPMSVYAAKLAPTPHNNFFVKEMRLDPSAMNLRESEEMSKKLDDLAQENKTEAPATEDIVSGIAKELMTARPDMYDEETARTTAEVHASIFEALGKRVGKDPVELFKQYALSTQLAENAIPVEGALNQDRVLQSRIQGLSPEATTQARVFYEGFNASVKRLLTAMNVEQSPEKIQAARTELVDLLRQLNEFEHGGNTLFQAGRKKPKLISPQEKDFNPRRKNEHIVGAAIKLPNGDVYAGDWHGAAIDSYFEDNFPDAWKSNKPVSLPEGTDTHGFITSTGRYVTEVEAEQIMLREKQIKGKAVGEMTAQHIPEQDNIYISDEEFYQSSNDAIVPLLGGFFSKAESIVEQKMPARATPADIRGLLKDIKAEEREWLGLDKYLDSLPADKKVSKQELTAFLQASRLNVVEVTKTEFINDERVLDDAWDEFIRNYRRHRVTSDFRIEHTNEGWKATFLSDALAAEPWEQDHLGERVGGDEVLFHSRLEAVAQAERFIERMLDDAVIQNDERATIWVNEQQVILADMLSTEGGDDYVDESYESYTLPGGENYRVYKFTLPGVYGTNDEGSQKFQSAHFPELNIFAHIRVKDRTLPDGRKMFFVEETQSDWHQQGREKGYVGNITDEMMSDANSAIGRARNTVDIHAAILSNKYGDLVASTAVSTADQVEAGRLYAELHRAELEYDRLRQRQRTTIPNAPFKRTWHEFVMKRVLRLAAEGGYDVVGWTTGEQQAERYDLSKVADRISWINTSGENVSIEAYKKAVQGADLYAPGHDILQHRAEYPLSDLPDVIGKELTQKIVAEIAKDTRSGIFRGEDLKVGGHGMREWYDGILPKFMNSFTRKWGGKVEETPLDTPESGELMEDVHTLTLTPELKQAALRNEFSLYQPGPRGTNVILRYSGKGYPEVGDKLWYLLDAAKQAMGRIVQLNELKLLITPNTTSIEPWRLSFLVGNYPIGHLSYATHQEALMSAEEHGFKPVAFRQDEGATGPRGSIRFSENGVNINLFKNADLSTFLHETGHFYLEVLRDLAGSNESIKKDYDILRSWVGAMSETDVLTREQHEMIARGFEKYLMEGNAPSIALRAAFTRFRAWLTTIYRSLVNLKVELTPEVRGVFDRLVATEDEIATAYKNLGPLFTDPKAAGMTDEAAVRYEDAIAEARAASEEELTTKLIDDVRKEQKRQYKQQREQVRQQVADEVNQDPVWLAVSALSRNQLPDGSPLLIPKAIPKLNRQAIVDMYGGDSKVLLSLPQGIYTKDGGIHPDEAAALFGFKSGDEMLKALPGRGEGTALSRIERLTDEKMRAEHGDLYTDGRLPAEAMKAVHNDERAKLLHMELQHLASDNLPALKGLIRKVVRRVPATKQVRAEAERLIAGKKNRDINSNTYRQAEGKASTAAREALLKGDVELAFQEKLKETFNHELFRAASAAREEMDAVAENMARFNKTSTRDRLKKAGGSYLAQIDSIRERFDFRVSVTSKDLDSKQSLLDFVNEQADMGLPVDVPAALLNEANKKHYKDLTLTELRDIDTAVRQIEHQARLKNKLLASKRKREFNEAKADIIGAIEENHKRATEPLDLVPSLRKRLRAGLKSAMAAHTKMEFLFEWLDGNKDNGTVWQYLFKPFADAESAENKLQKHAANEMAVIFNEYSRAERARWFYNKIHVDGFETTFTKANLLTVAMNWGNEGNREAMMAGYGWTEEKVQKLLDLLDERDWRVVQAIWKHLETYWPAVAKLERELNGLPPERVEANPFQTKYGEMPGGYYPIVFESKLSWRQAKLNAREQVQDLYGGKWSRAMTKHGHTIERENSGGKPIVLDLSGLTEHVSNVIHDLTHRRAVIDVGRLTDNAEVRSAFEQTVGREMYRQINPWLVNIATDRRGNYTNAIEGLLGKARTGATVVNMGWKMTTAIVQFLGYTGSVKELGVQYAMLGLRDTYAHPWEVRKHWEFVTSRSGFMHDRLTTYDRDARDALKRLHVVGASGGPLSIVDAYTSGMANTWFSLIGWMDMGVSIPTWLAGYRKVMDGKVEGLAAGDEEAAIDYADKVVRQTQGVGSAKDLATVQSGSETFRLFTMFYSYFSGLFNQFVKVSHQYQLDKSKSKVIGAAMLLWFAPAVLSEVMLGRGPGDDADDEEWLKWLLKTELLYPLQSVILVRDIVNGMTQFGYEPSAAFDAYESISKTGRAIALRVTGDKDEFTRADAKAAALMVGYFTKLPARQVWLSAEYFYDWLTGEQEPANLLEGAWHTIVTGKPRD